MKIRSGFLELLHADIQNAYFTKQTRQFLQNLDTNALKNGHNDSPQMYGQILLLEGYVQPELRHYSTTLSSKRHNDVLSSVYYSTDV